MTKELQTGKKPPQAVDVEEVVLGAILIDKKYEIAFELLKPEVFYDLKHQIIFESMVEVFNEHNPIDIITISQRLKKNKQTANADELYLIKLTQKISSSAHLEYHCRLLLQKYIERSLIQSSLDIAKDAYAQTHDVFELLDVSFNRLNSISDVIVSNKTPSVNELTHDLLDHAEKLYNGDVEAGLPTPIKRLNELMGGWRDAELIILAGRPGMGKTAFAIKSAWILAKQNIPVGFFSLEMSAQKLLSRCWSIEAGISNSKFFKEGLSKSEVTQIRKAKNEIGNVPLYIEDKESFTINTLNVKAKKLQREQGIKILFVDYLQLMKGTGKNQQREQIISEISRGLKLLSTSLNIPVVALSQLSRSCETRGGDKRPILSDLRESGAIEQDADVVGFFYRPEYYFIEQWDDDNYNYDSTENEAEYIIAKNRNGGLGRNRMKFIKHLTDFQDVENNDIDDEDEVPFDINSRIEPNEDVSNAF